MPYYLDLKKNCILICVMKYPVIDIPSFFNKHISVADIIINKKILNLLFTKYV